MSSKTETQNPSADKEKNEPEQGKVSLDFIREKVADDVQSGRFGSGVQTRFPPEPNGYLHIGHAKAIALNFGIAKEFEGSCNLRFDDTNPETESQEFIDNIKADLEWLGFEPSQPIRYASDYFEQLYIWAKDLIVKGLAYVDDQDGETISEQRGGFETPGVNSPYRDRPAEENLELFEGMKNGEFPDGARTLRAKIDMQNTNMQMRDPVMYRIRRHNHYRTGDKWCIYPTYDWAHGQSDAIEGVTHSLCSLEFSDHRELYNWFLSNLDLPSHKPEQTEFARLNLTHTTLSKRVLAKLVDSKLVDGWDDPRMPTLSGLRRRGYPPSAIKAFVDKIGVARTNSIHDIELLESFVRNDLNKSALRRMAVLNPLKVVITNWPEGQLTSLRAMNNPENPEAGHRDVTFSGELWIEHDDFMLEAPKKFYRLSPGKEVRLRAGFYITAQDVSLDSDGNPEVVYCTYDPESEGGSTPDGRKVKATMHWVSTAHAITRTVNLYDRMFAEAEPNMGSSDPTTEFNTGSRTTLTNAKLEAALETTSPGQAVQFERLGYFAADIDDPKIFHQTVGLRDEWANIQKRRAKGN